MQVRQIALNANLDIGLGGIVVCIPAEGASEHLVSCLRSVLEHTASAVPIVVCDSGAGGSRDLESLAAPEDGNGGAREVLCVRADDGAGLLGAVQGALAIAAPADAVVLRPDCEVAAEWLDRLRQAAYSDSTVATARALSCGPTTWNDAAAASVRLRSLRLRPRLSSATGPCLYVRRAALELVGDIDAGLISGGDGDGEFSQRCVRSGLTHVLADDVLVLDRLIGRRDERSICSPADGAAPLTRSLSRVRRALSELCVVVDARILSGPTTGTQVHVLEAIAALARTDRVKLSAVVPDHLNEHAARCLRSWPKVTLLAHEEAADPTRRRADLVHRPYQVNNPGDLTFLLTVADRLVITQQDLIGYHNPSYFPSPEAWDGYRQLTRTTLAIADRALFFSAHGRDDALADDLIDPTRANVVPIGVDHQATGGRLRSVRPSGAEGLPDGVEVILCLGTDYRHKNRPFALRLLEQLQLYHSWRGRLVLAGPHVVHGSSAPDEERLLARTPTVAEAVSDLGAVSEAEKAWLLDRASLVMYPTVREGFGLVPFEAANHGVPCMWAAGTALSEVLPDEAATIVPWDVAQSVDRALELLRDEGARRRNVEVIRSAGERLTWDATGARLLEVYEATCDAPSPPAATLERRYGLLSGGLSEDAMRLMGPGGILPPDLERPLLALATHPRIGSPVFRALRLGYRASYKVRRWGRGEGPGKPPPDRQSLR
ncbi:MAG: glycosyltransferase [Solirubrobacterales bacterium]|nr:glycosyltransferase [Solirubrobacterales bacterium]